MTCMDVLLLEACAVIICHNKQQTRNNSRIFKSGRSSQLLQTYVSAPCCCHIYEIVDLHFSQQVSLSDPSLPKYLIEASPSAVCLIVKVYHNNLSCRSAIPQFKQCSDAALRPSGLVVTTTVPA